MLRYPFIASSLLSLAAASAGVPKFDFLSPEAQTVATEARALHEKIRDKVEAVCPPDANLHETIKKALDATTSESGRAAVFAQYKEQMQAEHTRMRTCMKTNESSLVVWKDLGRDIHEACMIRGFGGPGGPEGGFHKGGHEHHPLSDEQKQELGTKLTSEACSQAIATAQSKLQ